MTFRCFAAADEAHADGWVNAVQTTDVWTIGNAVGLGESGSFHATCSDGRKGVAKPAFSGPMPRAAHEKIASDLAYHLKLPVPAVCLWTNPANSEQFALSVWAFAQAANWGAAKGTLSATFLQNSTPVFSALRVFHTWIGDTDHDNNDGNVLVDLTCDETTPRLAFIDHAFSMTYAADFAGGVVRAVPFSYITTHPVDRDATNNTIDAINQLEANMIEAVVQRMPASFLPADRSDAILKGLLARRNELSALLRVA